jgi:hypothetical protein
MTASGDMKARKRVLFAAICVLAPALGAAGGQLADAAMHPASAARKHIAGVKYEDIPSPTATKSGAGAAPQKSIGIRKR